MDFLKTILIVLLIMLFGTAYTSQQTSIGSHKFFVTGSYGEQYGMPNNNQDICNNLAGSWEGTVKEDSVFGYCRYKAKALGLTNKETFYLTLSLSKPVGRECDQIGSFVISGFCVNGQLIGKNNWEGNIFGDSILLNRRVGNIADQQLMLKKIN